ncbi:MAG: SIMPL domain-containing protein [Pseudobdellovibrionaceae bacterium]
MAKKDETQTEKCHASLGDGVLFAALLLTLGLIATGWFISSGLTNFRNYDRYVTVKGLATKDIEADLAIWSLSTTVTGADLVETQGRLEGDGEKVRAFFAKHGFEPDNIKMQNLQVTDNEADPYSSNRGGPRFVLSQTYIARTADPQKMIAASEDLGTLLKQGVVIGSGQSYSAQPPQYLYTKLNDVKTQLLEEATANARQSAEQFAKDSGQDIGVIRTANQGVFQVLPRDPVTNMQEEQQFEKTLRVVVTLDYYLRD